MSNLYSRFQTNSELEAKAGVVLDYGEGLKVRIRRAGGANREYHRALRESLMKAGRRISSMSDEESMRGMAEIYAETVIIGWEGVTDAEGQPVEFTKENAVKILTDLPEFFRDIQEAASSVSLFRAQQKAEITGK